MPFSTGFNWLFSNNPDNRVPSTAGSTSYGVTDDIPVSGDWDGDGIDTIGIFRPSDGQWHLTNTRIWQVNQGSPSASIITYGSGPEIGKPVNGAWAGGLPTGLGLRRGVEFSLKNESGASGNSPIETNVVADANIAFDYGQVGDVPVAGRWRAATATPTPTLSIPLVPAVGPQRILVLLCQFAGTQVPTHPTQGFTLPKAFRCL